MRSVWVGGTTSPSTSSTNFNLLTANLSTAWDIYEHDTFGNGRCAPMTENFNVTRMKFWVNAAPGTGKSWTFTFRSNSSNTAASVTISGSNTSAVWTGLVNISAQSLCCLTSVPSGTPADAVRVWWCVEYTTPGDFYLAVGFSNSFQNITVGEQVFSAFATAANPSWVLTDNVQVAPCNLTITKIGVKVNNGALLTQSGYVRIRKNNTTDSDAVDVLNGTTEQYTSITPFSVSAGDTIIYVASPSGSQGWTSRQYCATIYPQNLGDVVMSFANVQAPGAGPDYEGITGAGSFGYSSTESNVYMRLPKSTLRNFYVQLQTAPSAGNSRVYTVRQNTADTSLTATVANTNIAANDTSHSFNVQEGDFLAVKQVASGSPLGTAGLTYSFVMTIPQTSIAGIASITGISSITL